MKFCYLDFEFNHTEEAKLNLVSLSFLCRENAKDVAHKTIWLYKDPGAQTRAAAYLRKIKESGYTFVAFAAEAEARSMISLGFSQLEIIQTPFIDLYCEYRCLLNHNHAYAYGKQLVDGKIRTTKPPKSKWDSPNPNEDNSKPSYSLAAACFKLLKVEVDTEEKTAVRDKIISDDGLQVESVKSRVLKYNESDIEYLPRLLNKMWRCFKGEGVSRRSWIKGAYSRGEYSLATALMVTKGYPVNMVKVRKFMSNLDKILASTQEACNEEGVEAFVWNEKLGRYVGKEKVIRDWLEKQGHPYWRKTDKGKLSLSKDAFNDYYDSTSEGFGGAYYRFLKTKQSLNGFSPGTSRSKFTDFVGSDSRARPYFGIYGSQSSRSQPAATGFLALKAHWMRNFIEAKPGRAICEIDYASQEFLVAALLSQDKNMIEAYESGDPYTAFGIQSGLMPKGATKRTHGELRDKLKTLVLGMSYGMSAKRLAHGIGTSEDKAQALIDRFYNVYSDYYYWKEDILDEYRNEGKLRTADHWYMFGDNRNPKSVLNFPVQAHGAVVMRDAVKLAHRTNIKVIFTLHDALYIEYPSDDLRHIKRLRTVMEDAFLHSFLEIRGCHHLSPIRTEGCAWSVDYTDRLPEMKDIHFMDSYVDDKGRADYERFKQYFL